MKMLRISLEILLVSILLICFAHSVPLTENDFNLGNYVNRHRIPKISLDELSNYISSNYKNDDMDKRASSTLWFGPRLGKRKRSHEDDFLNEYLDESNESAEKLLDNLKYLNERPLKFMVDNGKSNPAMIVYFIPPENNENARLEREAAEKQLKPFPIRYGRQLPPYSPRLGRQLINDLSQHSHTN